ncbi:uncharacterized protein LOC124644361 [Helicoverpa zea]|uniref:uncharacterized protein LOC124644361 n=1 Tax=Helicoverpa zea TaxID=7113 RepID=UPI001F55EE31|nr:uncharacterized protein LOC124644361 [Helicoverpa zea]
MKFLQVVLLALAALVASVAAGPRPIPNVQNPVVVGRIAEPNFVTVPFNCPPGQEMSTDGVCREPWYAPEDGKPENKSFGDGFVMVQRRKRRQRANKNRCGKAPVYISRLHYTTKAEDIVEYVRQKLRYNIPTKTSIKTMVLVRKIIFLLNSFNMKFLQVVLLALVALVASVAAGPRPIPNVQNPVVVGRIAEPNFVTVPFNCPPGQEMSTDGVCREPWYAPEDGKPENKSTMVLVRKIIFILNSFNMKFLQVVLLALAALVASVAAGPRPIPNVQNPVVVGRIAEPNFVTVPFNCPPGQEMSTDGVCREPWYAPEDGKPENKSYSK